MTQIDARNAVKRINKKLSDMLVTPGLIEGRQGTFLLLDVIHDLEDMERQLSERKQAMPNCRKATPEELRQLCTSSNVVVLSPVA